VLSLLLLLLLLLPCLQALPPLRVLLLLHAGVYLLLLLEVWLGLWQGRGWSLQVTHPCPLARCSWTSRTFC
jgi:hypothetical protein